MPTPDEQILTNEQIAEISREAERLPTDYNVIEPLLVRDCYEGQEASPWMGHTRPAAEAYAAVPALCRTVKQLREQDEWQKSTIENLTVGLTGCAEQLNEAHQKTFNAQREAGDLQSQLEQLRAENAALTRERDNLRARMETERKAGNWGR